MVKTEYFCGRRGGLLLMRAQAALTPFWATLLGFVVVMAVVLLDVRDSLRVRQAAGRPVEAAVLAVPACLGQGVAGPLLQRCGSRELQGALTATGRR